MMIHAKIGSAVFGGLAAGGTWLVAQADLVSSSGDLGGLILGGTTLTVAMGLVYKLVTGSQAEAARIRDENRKERVLLSATIRRMDARQTQLINTLIEAGIPIPPLTPESKPEEGPP
jgi:hypothetical protein